MQNQAWIKMENKIILSILHLIQISFSKNVLPSSINEPNSVFFWRNEALKNISLN